MANTLKIKRGSNATVPQGQLAEPLFTTDTYDLYIGKGSGGNQRFQKYIASGTSSQFLKGDGTLDSTTYQATSEKGQNNGYASLDSGGKVPVAQLPNSIMEYLGTWDASTNTPTLANGTGNAGDVYICSVAGTVNFGAGPITFAAGDWVVYSGSIWQKSINSNSVASVNGQTGAVVLYTDDISEDGSPVNLWFTNARARTAISLTTSGTSGAATYDNSTGVLNVPNYGGALSGYLPLTGGTLTGALNGTSASFNSTVTTPAGFYIDANTYLYEGILRLTDLVNKKNILQLQATASGHYITSTFLSGGSQQAIYLSAKSTAGQNVTFNTDGTTTFSHAVNGTSSSMSSTSTATAFIPTGSTVPTNGMYLPSANTLGLSANSTKVIEISDSGRVSIGATSPTTDALTVHGAITTTNGGNITSSGMISSNSTISSGLNIIAASSITGSALVPSGTTAPTVGMYLVSGTSILNGVLGFSTGSTKRLEINNSTGDATFTNNISAANLSGTNTGDQTLSGLGGVPTTRTITINGTSFDLSANRTYSVGTIGGSGTSGYVSKFTGSTTIGNSLIYDSGSRAISIGNSSTNSWASPFYVIEGGTYGQFIGFQTNNPAFKLGTNSYFNGSNYIYTNTGYGVSILDIGSDATNAYLDFYGAPTGTAGNAATISKKFSIDNTGNAYFVESLGVGFTSGTINGRIDFRNAGNAIIVGKNTTGGTNTYSSIRLTTANSGGVGDSIGEIRGLSTNVNNRDTALTFLTSEGSAGQTEKMRITAGGNVGIGTNSPEELLELSSSNTTGGQFLMESTGSSTGNYAGMRFKIAGGSDGGYEKAGIFAVRGSGGYNDLSLVFATNTAATTANVTTSDERMRITSGGNVGIGTSSPTNLAASYRSLCVNGSSAGFFETRVSDVSSGRYISDSNGTGIGDVRSGKYLYLYTEDTERMRITSGGNVGIGVTPSAWFTGGAYKVLQLGPGLSLDSGNDYRARIAANAYVNTSGDWTYTNTGYASIYTQYQGNHIFESAASGTSGNTFTFSEKMRITSGGNVGIGETSPSSKLHVVGTSLTNTFRVTDATNYTIVMGYEGTGNIGMISTLGSTAKLALGTNSTARLTVDGTGNVGIGISSPNEKLQVAGAIAATGTATTSFASSSTMDFYNGYTRFISRGANTTTAGAYEFLIESSNSSISTKAMTITSGGAVLVNVTSASSQGEKFNATNSNLAAMFKTTGGATNNWAANFWNNATSGNNLFVEFGTESAYTGRGNIDYNRGAGLVRYNTTSDANLKNIIGDSDRKKSIDILNSTRIREYSWKDDINNKIQIGVIAQELYETYKGAVSEGSDVSLFGTKEYKNWSVDKTAFTFHLIAGWQEHERIIQEQQQQIEQLKSILI